MISFDLRSILTLILTADALVNGQVIHRLLSSKKQKLKYLLIEQGGALLGMLMLYLVGIGAVYVLKTPVSTIKFTSGFVILLSGLQAAFNKNNIKSWEDTLQEDQLSLGSSLFVPCALPLIVGPSWFSAALILTTNTVSLTHDFYLIFLSWMALSLCILAMHILGKKIFNSKGLKGLQTVVGLVITIIGVQTLLEGLKLAFMGSH